MAKPAHSLVSQPLLASSCYSQPASGLELVGPPSSYSVTDWIPIRPSCQQKQILFRKYRTAANLDKHEMAKNCCDFIAEKFLFGNFAIQTHDMILADKKEQKLASCINQGGDD